MEISNRELTTDQRETAPGSRPACLDEMLQRIVQHFTPLRVILFGSWARGDARPDSDVDLLVVLPQVDNKRQTAIRIGNVLSDLPVSKDIVVATPAEIAARSHVVGSILQPAIKEGKVIYEHA